MDEQHCRHTLFLSPEQAQGSHTHHAVGYVCVGVCSTIYPPAQCRSKMRMVSILAAHVKRQIAAASSEPGLSPSFSWLLHRLMMKHPGNISRLEECPTGHPPLARR